MASAALGAARLSSRTRSSALFVSLSLAHAAALATWPSIPLIGIAMWWSSNTIAHNFIHQPFFSRGSANAIFSCWMTITLGVPQALWRARHLAHHAEGNRPAESAWKHLRVAQLVIECALLAILWTALFMWSPAFALFMYAPGLLLGLALCQLQGHYEHAHGTTSHYGRIYNLLFFNDGFHVEHHARPGAHWSELRRTDGRGARSSRWPPILRWLDACSLTGLERLVLRSPRLQRYVVRVHERAARSLIPPGTAAQRILIVGGGLFPRSAIVMRRLFREAQIVIADADAAHIDIARPYVDDDVECRVETWRPDTTSDYDLIVIPLAFIGDRARLLASPPAPAILIHTWLWSRIDGVVVSWPLLKKLSLVSRPPR